MLKQLVLIAAVFAAQSVSAALDGFVLVQGDAALKVAGLTRSAYNEKNPAAAKRWREAWAAKGTKADNREFIDIRARTTSPADTTKSPVDTASAPRKEN